MSLELVSVTRRFGSQLALDSINLHVRNGDCYGLIGHNGSGKTTSMRIALGLQRADSGLVLVDGFDACAHPREARARMGALIETPGFHPALDGGRNLRLLARLQGLSRDAARTEAARLLELVGLGYVGPKPVQAYSQGMRQRLGIAQALLGSPRYVLLDEPTNGLDPQGIAEIRELLRGLVQEHGLTVLVSSHQLHEIADLCNRIGVMHRGRLVVEADTPSLLREAAGRFEVETRDDARAAKVLAAEGIPSTPLPAGGLELSLGARAPGEVARVLVAGDVDIRRLGARAANLEEIYLRLARGEKITTTVESKSVPSSTGAPSAKLAPPRPIARVLRYEIGRWLAHKSTFALLALPAVVATASVWMARQAASENAARVARGELASTTDVTGFQTTASALASGLPLLALCAAGMASQMIAGELARGTLRNVLLRSNTRAQTALGKWSAGTLLVLAAYMGLVCAALGSSAIAFGFRDLSEILPDGQTFPLVAAADLQPDLLLALAKSVVPLCGFLSLGFLAGALVRGAAGALALALGGIVFLDLARGIARGFGLEGWLLTAHAPSPLGDTSFLQYFADRAEGISNATFEFGARWIPGVTEDVGVSLLWSVAAFALATVLFARRSVP